MNTRALLLGVGLLAASVGPALTDSVTGSVNGWDATNRTLTMNDKSQFANISTEVAVPELKQGDLVTIDYYADEDGIQAIDAITVNSDVARQQTPQKRG